jgi:translation initiation factor 5
MSVINVDPQKKDDAFYRYKMPSISTKIEGNGNGIKTVFPNIHDVCVKLNRPSESLSKFLGIELGAQSTYHKADDKFLVMGSHTQERIQEKVYDFIKRFVLCKACRNPETDVHVGGKNKLSMTCRGCGKTTDISSTERIANFLVLHYGAKQKAEGGKKGAKAAEKPTSPTGAEAEAMPEQEAEVVAAPAPAVKKEHAKIQSTSAELSAVNPIEVFADMVHQTPVPDLETCIHKVFTLKTEHNLKEAHVVRLVLRGSINGVDGSKFIGKLQEQVPLLRHFTQNVPELQETCLKDILVVCYGYKAPEKVPMAIKMLWEEGVVSDSVVIDWYDTYKLRNKEISKEFFEAAKKANAPLIAWLQESE